MRVLGLSCHYHDAAACLVQDGRVVAAAQEERFNRAKNCADFPLAAINFCLQEADCTLEDVDRVVFYEKPFLKLERVVVSHLRAWPRSRGTFLRTLPPWLQDRLIVPLSLRRDAGYEGPVHFIHHHLSHAASAFLSSPFEQAAILTADGVGEWATATRGTGRGHHIELLDELRYPHSLGLVYTAVTTHLGFHALTGEGKVMALADFGEPRYLPQLEEMVRIGKDGAIRVDPRAFPLVQGDRMYGPRFVEVFGPPRDPEADPQVDRHYRDLAASLQAFLEKVLVTMARDLQERTGLRKLCLAGGIFLNVAANSRILEQTDFDELFIQPGAGDAGGALGSALYLYHTLSGADRSWRMDHAYLGPGASPRAMRRVLVNAGASFRELTDAEMAPEVARLLDRGDTVGWYQGRLEFGPRALGHRSILADPRSPTMKDHLNQVVKNREWFRPYGVSVLRDRVGEYFEFEGASPYMLQVAQARPRLADRIPSALHVNGTSRLQTVTAEHNGLYHDVVAAFADRTGVPMIINTSFNGRGEPIVCSPEDAWGCFTRLPLDHLAMGPFLVSGRPDASPGAEPPTPGDSPNGGD